MRKTLSLLLSLLLFTSAFCSSIGEESTNNTENSENPGEKIDESQPKAAEGDSIPSAEEDASGQSMEAIFQKYDPEGNNKIKVNDYAPLLKEVMKSSVSEGKKIDPNMAIIMDNAIDFYIKDKELDSKSFVTYEEILEDIQSEKILNLVKEYLSDHLASLKREEL